MSAADEINDRLVASALEFAIGVAAAGTKTRPQLPFPAGLKPYLKFQKLPAKALADVRRVIEADQRFLDVLGTAATSELLDEAGMIWLTRPDGWREQLTTMQADAAAVDAATALRRSERRRDAAQQMAHRAIAELAVLRAEVARLNEHVSCVRDAGAQARREHDEIESAHQALQAEVRHLNDRLKAATDRVESLRTDRAEALARAAAAEQLRDSVLMERAELTGSLAAEHATLEGAGVIAASLREQIAAAQRLTEALRAASTRLDQLEPRTSQAVEHDPAQARRRRSRSARRPIAVPGGLYGASPAAAEFLVRHRGVMVMLDGYNVAKLAWPKLALDAQRGRCIDTAEDVARRFGTSITVVFDGADITGAAAPGRRVVRVVFSPEGVSADDVLRAEVGALRADAAVVVVTNDQAVVTDVRAMGANTMTSEQWLQLAGRWTL